MAKRTNLTATTIQELVGAYQSGMSARQIARKMGIGQTSVLRWVNRMLGGTRSSRDARKMRGRATHVTDVLQPEIDRMCELHIQGMAAHSIAKQVKRSVGTVIRHLKAKGIYNRSKIEPDQVARLMTEYKAGMTGPDLAKKYQISPSYVHKLLVANRVVRRNSSQAKRGRQNWKRRALTLEDSQEACRLYQEGWTQKRVAEHFRVGACSVQAALAHFNVPTERRYHPPTSGHKFPYRDARGRNLSFRSTWELAFAECLDDKGVTWEYESQSFSLSNRTLYVPDFYVAEWDQYVEIKGYMRKDAAQKIQLFRQEFPEHHLVVVTRPAFLHYRICTPRHGRAYYITLSAPTS